jgi:hypothetical protein
MLEVTEYSLSLEGEGRVRVFDLRDYSQLLSPLTSILSPLGRGGVTA